MDSSRRCGNMLAVLCVLLSLTAGGLAWVNHYDQFFTFNCPHGQGIYYMKSQHSNPTEDRQFNFECVDMPGAPNDVVFCSWTNDYVNAFDKPVVYMCPADFFLAGVQSYHENPYEDRRFKYKCCRTQGRSLRSCYSTGWLNEFDQAFTYRSPPGFVVTGMASYHQNAQEDRRFQLFQCYYN